MKKIGTILATTGIGIAVGYAVDKIIRTKSLNYETERVEKFKMYYNLLNQWLSIKQEGQSLSRFFLDNNYKTIAIYGMGELGNRLFLELKDSTIVVKYAIDQEAGYTYSDMEVLSLDNELENVDAVIVTPIFAYRDISEKLSDKVNCPIISLEEVIYSL